MQLWRPKETTHALNPKTLYVLWHAFLMHRSKHNSSSAIFRHFCAICLNLQLAVAAQTSMPSALHFCSRTPIGLFAWQFWRAETNFKFGITPLRQIKSNSRYSGASLDITQALFLDITQALYTTHHTPHHTPPPDFKSGSPKVLRCCKCCMSYIIYYIFGVDIHIYI